MNCKHGDVISINESNGAKTYYCQLFKTNVSEYRCQNCMMRIYDDNFRDIFGQIFGQGFGGK